MLPIDVQGKQLFDAIDGKRTIGEIARERGSLDTVHPIFEQLWWYDRVVFDASRCKGLPLEATLATRNAESLKVVKRSPLGQALGHERMFFNLHEAVQAFGKRGVPA